MADLAFFLDFAPILSAKKQRAAIILYLYYDKFSNKRGVVNLTYKELQSCLGFSTRIVSEADEILEKMGLIRTLTPEEVKQFQVKTKGRAKVRQVLSLEFMDDAERQERFESAGLPEHDTTLRDKYRALYMELPEYQRLINVTSLQAAYVELGEEHFVVVSRLAKFFGLDTKIIYLVLEDKKFKRRFREMAQLAKDNVKNKKVVRQSKGSLQKTPAELCRQLMEDAHMTRGTKTKSPEPLPIEKWKSQAILRYFLLGYKKKYNIEYAFSSSPFRSREMKECKRLLGIFSPEEAVTYIDWLFATQKNVTGPAYALYPNILNAYRRTAYNNTKANGFTGVRQEFVQWVHDTLPDFTRSHALGTVADLQWLQKLVEQKAGNEDIEQVVKKAQEMGIL